MSYIQNGGGGGGAGTPGGVDTNIQFNDATAFGGATNFVYIKGAGQVSLTTTTDSSSTVTGALIVAGGVGIAKQLYVGSNVNIPFSTASVGVITFGAAQGLAHPNVSGTWLVGDTGNLAITGADNFLAGRIAGTNITSATRNICIGAGAGRNILTGGSNIAIGFVALGLLSSAGTNTAANNVCIGPFAGNNITNGSGNMCIGNSSGPLLTTGQSNVAIGENSLAAAISASFNMAIGASALNAVTGSNNVAVGRSALGFITSGHENVGIGYQAGTNYTTSEAGNVVIGGHAGTAGESNVIIISDGNGSLRLDYAHTNANGWSLASGFVVGAATGGYLGAGTINVATSISLNNGAYTNPDYVLEHFYTGKIEKFVQNKGAEGYDGLMPLDELRDYTKNNWHLPRIGDQRCIFERSDIMLEKLEESFLYIMGLEERIRQLEGR